MDKVMKVKCPHEGCDAVITIPDIPGVAERMLTCPICKYRNKVAVFIAEMNKSEEVDTECCLLKYNDSIGVLKIADTEYALEEDKNTIGRKAPSSTADVQLAVEDKHMSREHISITVVKKSNGYQHRIENITTRNHVFVNGNEMKAGEMLILQHGDVIRLGKTEIQFVRISK